MLAGGTWIIRGTLFLGGGGIIQNFGSIQEVLFLEVALTESWVICESSHGDGGWV
jgi:H+-transporting ATPase